MTISTPHILSLAFVAAIALHEARASAQTAPSTSPAGPTITAIAISPKPLEDPALSYALLPKMHEIQPGNAALKYHMAIESFLSNRTHGNADPQEDQTLDKLSDGSLAQIDEDAARKILEPMQGPFRLLYEGSRMESISWEISIRQDGVSALLPYLGPLRAISRRLEVAIRLDIKNHRWKDANEKLRTGYALAHRLDAGETIIDVLVGAAIAGQMNACLRDWVSQPDAPNLFWPIANLPQPLTSIRNAAAWERSFVNFSFPEWQALSEGNGTPELLGAFAGHFSDVLVGISSNPAPFGKSPFERQSVATAFIIGEYPRAKQFLIQRGASADEIEKRSAASVFGEYFTRSYDEAADDLFKCLPLPSGQAFREIAKADKHLKEQIADNSANVLARMYLPALSRAVFKCTQPDRTLAALRIAEALRAYATRHNALPDSLDQLGLPLANDPISGDPFAFERRDNTVIITSSMPPNPIIESHQSFEGAQPRDAIRYEITLRPR